MGKISLEALANKIEILTERGIETLKIVRIEGYVTSAEGGRKDASHRNYLRVYLNPIPPIEITQLNFYGTTPVREGDKVRVGIILDEKMSPLLRKKAEVGEAFYIEIIDERGKYLRRDFRDNCEGPWFNRDLGLEN